VELRAWLAFVAAGEIWGGELLAAILAGARRKARVVVLGWWYGGGEGGVSEELKSHPNLAQVLWLWLAGWRELRPGFTWGTAHALIDQMPDVPTAHACSRLPSTHHPHSSSFRPPPPKTPRQNSGR